MWTQTAQITGRVANPSNAAVFGDKVNITNTETGVTCPVKTNPAGYFVAQVLPRGSYEVHIQN